MDNFNYRNVEDNPKYALQQMVEAQLPILKSYKPRTSRATWALEVDTQKEKWRGKNFQHIYEELLRIASNKHCRVVRSQIINKAIEISEELNIPYEEELRCIRLEVPIIREFEQHLHWIENIECTGKVLYYFFILNEKLLKVIYPLLTHSQTKQL